MSQIRKDYILDRWVIVSKGRMNRPYEFKHKQQKHQGTDFFAPGNEGLTPPEIGRIPKKGGWLMRWFPNKFPVVNDKRGLNIDTPMLIGETVKGEHEIIAETDSDKQLHELPVEHISQLLKIYASRIAELSREWSYVSVFKNHGPQAGTSIVHSHSQVVAIDRTPPEILELANKSVVKGECKFCEILKTESKTKRRIGTAKTAVAFAPYASRYHYEAVIFPKRHVKSILEYTEEEYIDTALLIKKIIGKLGGAGISYNMYLNYAPKGKNLHFHITFTPREATFAGFELSTGIIVNSVPPEDAAAWYRE
ncbi:DUF4931 domain-containing protein [Candidatus Woesearchaeota archaeon]|nr:DUF4931 domain-containing protein [Candidatus Woesearchaeota archaeon]